jgi:hypothetical protein
MKNYFPYILLAFVFSFSSCKKQEKEKPKVIYDTTTKEKVLVKMDTTQIKVADLPINMEGTNYLIYPIGTVTGEKKGMKYANDSEDSFTVSNYGEFQITGFLKNLKFQEIGQDTIYALTDKPVLILTATYLKSIATKSKKQLLVYTLTDIDSNKDNKLDTNDIKSIYISAISGKNLTKLSTDFQELIDWKVIEAKNSLYFRSIEDTNKNGEFDKDDKVHYNVVNLMDTEWLVQEYFPI